jgi:acyl-CoA reductase-like NAD-dependent aldehyde dehydrogenase
MSESSARIYRNYIGGAWLASPARRHAPNINPANAEDYIGDVPLSISDEAIAAAEVAAHAFRSWRRTPAPERGRWCFAPRDCWQNGRNRSRA